MCRLLGVVTRRPRPLNESLAGELAPFLAMAGEHADGWGIASVTSEGAVTSVKEPVRADTRPGFDRTVRGVTTDAALLHLRMASPRLAVNRGNTHPFGDREMAFAHNGDFTPVDCLDPLIGEPALASAEGDTDSERFYLGVRGRIDDGMQPPAAIMSTAVDIRLLAAGFASLNCLLLTPRALYAFTAHDPHSEVIRRRGPGYFALSYRVDQDAVVVASTSRPQEAPQWHAVPAGYVLEIRRDDLTTTIHAD